MYTTYPTTYAEVEPLFAQADRLREQVNQVKLADSNMWATILNRLRTDWTYHSNGIEGSTLSRGETHFFLSEGLTAEGKPFKDFLDAQNHAQAIDLLFDVVSHHRPISEGLIKEINALLLRGVEFTPAKNSRGEKVKKPAHPGRYKSQPNHVEQADGTIHLYVDPLHVQPQMAALLAWVNDALNQSSSTTTPTTPATPNITAIHAIHIAAVAHYNMVRIHPFDDGNGRGARILMNLILLHRGFFPAVVRLEKKPAYLQALNQADAGDLQPFIRFVADTLIASMQDVLDTLDKAKKLAYISLNDEVLRHIPETSL